MVAAVHLQPDVQSRPRERPSRAEGVYDDPERRARLLRDPPCMRDVARIYRGRPGEIVDPRPGEHLGLAERRDREASPPLLSPAASEPHPIVRLCVRAGADAESP